MGQISANLLRDEELVDLIAASGGKWVFIGMESLDPANLKDVNKSFNKPGEYAAVLERLAAVTSMQSRRLSSVWITTPLASRTEHYGRSAIGRPGCRSSGKSRRSPPLLCMTRLAKEGRLTRPTHWLDFAPFKMAHTPLKMSVSEVHTEVDQAWTDSYAPEATKRAMNKIADAPVPYKISHLIARLCFRGIYFPQKGTLAWVKVLIENRQSIFRIFVESFTKWRGSSPGQVKLDFDQGVTKV